MRKLAVRVGVAVGVMACVAGIAWAVMPVRPAAVAAAATTSSGTSGCTPPTGLSPAKADAWRDAPSCATRHLTPAQQAAASKSKAAARARLALSGSGSGSTPGAPADAGRIGTPAQLGGVPIPFSPAVTTITNMYFGLTPDGRANLDVYAGANTSDPAQGIVFIVVDNTASGSGTLHAYPLPKAGGIAELVSHTSQYVVVRDAQGEQFTFNIQASSWLP